MLLAVKLGQPLQRVQRETSSTEFVDWKVFLEMEVNNFHREDYYLAQIARVVAEGFSKKRRTIKEFLLKFTYVRNESESQDQPAVEYKSVDEAQEYTKRSKASWFGWAGITTPKD